MTSRQRTARNILLTVFAIATLAALIVGIRLSMSTSAAATERADHAATQLADVTAQLDQVTAERDDALAQRDDARARLDKARTQRDKARSQASERAATLQGQYDINAEYAQTIEDLKKQVATLKHTAPKTITKHETKHETKVVPDPATEQATEQALADMTEARDQAVAIADEAAADLEDIMGKAVETWYEDGSVVYYDGTSGCAPTALCND